MSLARSFMWMTLSEILFNVSGYIVHSGAGRILSPADYGRYGLVVSISIMIITLIGNGVPISVGKYISEFLEKRPGMIGVVKRKGFYLQIIIVFLITFIYYLLGPVIAKLLGDPTLAPLFQMSAFILPAYALDTYYFYYYTGIKMFNFQSFLKIVRSVLRVVLILGLIYAFQLPGAILGYIFVPLIVFLISWGYDFFFVSKRYPIDNPNVQFEWKKLLNYAWPITMFMIFYELLISLDLYFIKGILQDDYQTGIYNSALMVARIPYYLFYALTIILLPSVSGLTAKADFEGARKIVYESLRYMIIILVPIVVLLFSFSEEVITFIFGPNYIEGAQSLRILSFGIGFLTVFYIVSFALNGAGKVKIPMWIAFGGMLMNALLNYYLIHLWGIVGSAIATSFTSLIVMIIALSYSHIYFKGILKFKNMLKILFTGFIILVTSHFFRGQNWTFIPLGLIYFVFYLGLLVLFRELDRKDLAIVENIVRRKKKTINQY
jgi:stage V sporulation protein B